MEFVEKKVIKSILLFGEYEGEDRSLSYFYPPQYIFIYKSLSPSPNCIISLTNKKKE